MNLNLSKRNVGGWNRNKHQVVRYSFSPKTCLFIALLTCMLSKNLYGQAPTIAAFAPASGPIGTTVTITGTNFNTTTANNIVFFGATQAIVTAATNTQLT